MKIITTPIEGLLIFEPEVFEDDRGYFMEIYNQVRFEESGVNKVFVQDNHSYSVKGSLRGLHYQIKHPQAKLVQAIHGEIFDAVVDIRPGSVTFGKWQAVHLSDKNRRQLFIPAGFAHGFCVLSKNAYLIYKCSDYYVPHDEGGIIWNDPDIGIDWPVKKPIISEKDNKLPYLSDIPSDAFQI